MDRRVYLLEMSPTSAMEAAFGAGLCASLAHQHKEAIKWFGYYHRARAKKPDDQVTEAYFLQGKAFLEQELYDKAEAALLQALERDVMGTFYVEALDSYVLSQIALGHYVAALEQLLMKPQFRLSRQDGNRIMILKAHMFRLMGSYPTAIAHLLDGLTSLQDNEARALAYVELSTCHELHSELYSARQWSTPPCHVMDPVM